MATTKVTVTPTANTNIDIDGAINAVKAKYAAKITKYASDAKYAAKLTKLEDTIAKKIDGIYTKIAKWEEKVEAGKSATLNIGDGNKYYYKKDVGPTLISVEGAATTALAKADRPAVDEADRIVDEVEAGVTTPGTTTPGTTTPGTTTPGTTTPGTTTPGTTTPGTTTPGQPFMLTTGQDNLTGTAGADVFTARIFDNSNTLQSGDKVDGGAGVDRLNADVGTSQKFSITPETANVEQFAVRAQAVATDTNNNNMADQPTATYANASQIDAERMVGVNWFESNNSRADVVIEDVRILPNQITKDITIAMVETDPGNVDFGVYFDQYSLRNVTSSTSTLKLELADTRSIASGTAPLKDNPYWGFTFKLDGTTQTVTSDAIDAAQTYAELLAAVQASIAANPALAGKVTASLGNVVPRMDTLSGTNVGVTELVLTTTNGGKITIDGTTGWQTKNGTVPSSSGLHTFMNPADSTSTDLVTAKIVLDDVGRGSTGGDLVVGGLSVGDTSTSKGVERFEIEVRDNSKLQTINSTNNTLREVTIKNGATSSNSFAYVTTTKDAGNLTVNGTLAANAENVALPGSAAQHNAYGFSDVRLIDASTMTGKLAFTAEITEASIAKYLNLKDTQGVPAADNVAFVYTGGTNDDTLVVDIDSKTVASQTTSGREDFTFSIDGGAGNDSITLDLIGATGPWYVDQKLLKNVSVIGGAGNDTIRTLGAGDVNVDAGAGNDTVYADNTGAINATWFVAATNTVENDLQTSLVNTGNNFLYKGKLTVTFSGAQGDGAGSITGRADPVGDAAALTNGWEVVVDIPTGANYTVTQLHINQAIKAAINNDPVLSKLVVAQDGPGYTLTIKSLIDGRFDADDLLMTVSGVDVTTLTNSEQATVLSAYKLYSANSTATIANAQAAQLAAVTEKNLVTGMNLGQVATSTGAFSAVESDNTINLGSGDDVVVLGSGDFSNDTIVFTGYNLGKKTIVNFENAGVGVADGDYLNFNSYLTGKASHSGSTESQQAIATAWNADTTVEANSVTVLNGVFTAVDTFAGLTAAKLLSAINSTNTGAANYAGLNAATLDAVNTYNASGVGTTLVGGVGKAVVLVENNLNRGEYKAFELTFTGTASNTTRDFSAVQEIAVVDIGATGALQSTLTTAAPAVAGGVGAVVVPPVVVPGGTTPVAVAAAGTTDAAAANFQYNLNVGTTYTYNVTNFAAGDRLVFDAGTATGVNNTSGTDGAIQVVGTLNGQAVTVNLTGVALASDAGVFGVNSFNTVFGAGSLA